MLFWDRAGYRVIPTPYPEGLTDKVRGKLQQATSALKTDCQKEFLYPAPWKPLFFPGLAPRSGGRESRDIRVHKNMLPCIFVKMRGLFFGIIVEKVLGKIC